MVFLIFFTITVILLISFAVTKKNLHLFEILFIWMIVNILHHNFLTVTALNLKIYDYSKEPERYWALVFFRIFLKPLIIVWYFDLTSKLTPRYKFWAWLPVGISVLVGVEYMANQYSVLTRWNYWWSIAEWLIVFLVVYFPLLWYRNALRKEVNQRVGGY